MEFFECVDRTASLLETHGRVTRRGLSREFNLNASEVVEIADELVVRGKAVWQGDVLVAVAEGVESAAPVKTTPPESSGEMRHLTVMFCDLIGSTELSARLSAERWSETIRLFHETARQAIEQWSGHVGNYMGDGLVAYFGYPIAQENAAERAVRAGLDIVNGLGRLNGQLDDTIEGALQVRVGVHSGPVVVDEFGGVVQAMGETANIAARIEGEADADGVAISPATRRLVSGVFVTEDLGARRLKGIADLIELTKVVRVGGVAPRLGPGRAGRTPLVGRALEFGLLDDRWQQVKEGWGQIIVITGEAGIGKSRLVDTFRESLADEPHSWLDAACSPYAQSATLFPMAELHRRALGLAADDPADTKGEALRVALDSVGLAPDRGVALLAELHGLPITDPVVGTMSPEHRRIEVFELLIEWLLELARLQPTVFFLDDVHWADPSTLEVFRRLSDEIATERLLLVIASRPDHAQLADPRSNVTPIQLSRMTREQTAKVATGAAGGSLESDLLASIVTRSDGVPLFAEELALALRQSDDGESIVPETLNDLLMARLEQLGPIREVAQSASIIGREFRFDEISLLSPVDNQELERLLDLGVAEELLYRSGSAEDATYVFKHALMRDAVYESMLASTRARRHQRFATALVERRPNRAAERPDLIAEHLTAGGDTARATQWWERAGGVAMERAAAGEAEEFLAQAIATCDPADVERFVDLKVRYAGALHATHGFAGAALLPVWDEIYELADRAGLARPASIATAGRAVNHVIGARFAEAKRELEVLAHTDGEDERTCHDVISTLVEVFSGSPAAAVMDDVSSYSVTDEFERAMGLEILPLLSIYGGYADFLCGRMVSSRRSFDVAQAAAAESVVPMTKSNVDSLSATMWAFRGQPEEEARLGSQAEVIGRRYGLAFFAALGGLHRACGLANTNPDPERIAEAQELLGELAMTGALIGAPLQIFEIARAQLLADDAAAARDTADYGLAIAADTGQPIVNPQLIALKLQASHRLGELDADWRDELATASEFAGARTLRLGSLALAMAAAEVSVGTPEHGEDLAELRRAIEAIPEPDNAPIIIKAQRQLDALAREMS